MIMFQADELPGMSMTQIQALCDRALPEEKASFRHYMDVAMVNDDNDNTDDDDDDDYDNNLAARDEYDTDPGSV